MNFKYYFSPLAVALALCLASPAKSAEPVSLENTTLQELKAKFDLSVPGVMKSSTSTSNQLQFVGQHTDGKKITHVRMQQYYLGFPVFGGYAIIHGANKSKMLPGTIPQSVLQMNGTVYDGLVTELGQPSASFVKDAQNALQRFKEKFSGDRITEERVIPMIFIDEKQQAHWAYKMALLITYEDKIPTRPTTIIDAKTNEVLEEWNNVKTEVSLIKGIGFGGNRKVGLYQYGKELPLLELTRDSATKTCFMENNGVRVIDMAHKYRSTNLPMSFICEKNYKGQENTYYTGYSQDGYDKSNGASSPTNDAMYAGYVINHMYRDWYGVDALTNTDGSPMQLVMRVHYGESYENAYWDGRQMTFGDGDMILHPLVSLGVGSHEISHGFTEQHSGLEYFGQSGGINEAFSDMAAQAAEYYSSGRCSWKIGQEIIKKGTGYDAIRYLDRPSRDGSSIDRADQYHDDLDVHYSSGVYNRFFYLLSNEQNWNTRKAFDVMVKANMDYWTPYSTFEEAACGVLSSAKDLGFPLESVKKALDKVSINYSSCPTETV